MKVISLLLIILITSYSSSISAQTNNLKAANTISSSDLNEPCPGKYYELYLLSDTEEQFGTAVMKLFFLVDKGFITRAANSGINASDWGYRVGKTFQRYCESSSIVTVRTAVKQTISELE